MLCGVDGRRKGDEQVQEGGGEVVFPIVWRFLRRTHCRYWGCNFSPSYSSPPAIHNGCLKNPSETANPTISPLNKNMCAICLDPLNYSSGGSSGEAIFTAQCSHSFHFNCISSNVRQGSITCPICRAQWTQLPRNLNIRAVVQLSKTDPVLQILDDSIANSRFHRRSFLQSARYDDDDPVDPALSNEQPYLQFSVSGPWTQQRCSTIDPRVSGSSSMTRCSPEFSDEEPFRSNLNKGTYLLVKLEYQPSTDVVLVACPDEPRLRMIKQAMSLVVFALRAGDRLAIVTNSSAASRAFPLRRMTPFGKKAALQVIDRLFYVGQVDETDGLKKAAKILSDRIHKNPQSCILHLTNSSATTTMVEDQFSIHQFRLGFRFGASNGLTLHQFEELLSRMMSGTIHDIQLSFENSPGIIRIRELRGGEEQRIRISNQECWPLHISYSCIDTREGVRLCGEATVGSTEKGDRNENPESGVTMIGISDKKFEYHDPFMARRWAKHLHGHRL